MSALLLWSKYFGQWSKLKFTNITHKNKHIHTKAHCIDLKRATAASIMAAEASEMIDAAVEGAAVVVAAAEVVAAAMAAAMAAAASQKWQQ